MSEEQEEYRRTLAILLNKKPIKNLICGNWEYINIENTKEEPIYRINKSDSLKYTSKDLKFYK